MPQNRLSELTNPSAQHAVSRTDPASLPDASSVFGPPHHTHLVHVTPTPPPLAPPPQPLPPPPPSRSRPPPPRHSRPPPPPFAHPTAIHAATCTPPNRDISCLS